MEYGISVVLVAIPGSLASSAVAILKTLSYHLCYIKYSSCNAVLLYSSAAV